MSTHLAVVTALALLACGPEEEQKSTAVGKDVTMRIGDSVAVEGAEIEVSFEDVVRDSRCPPKVQCIRAGEAVVVLVVTTRDGSATRLELEVPPGGGAVASLEGLSLRVVSLEPPASEEKRVERDSYVVDLVVEQGAEK